MAVSSKPMRQRFRGLSKVRALQGKYLVKCIEKLYSDFSDPDELYKVASFYQQRKNYQRAFDWYNKAAKLGHGLAEFNVAMCHLRGQGTARNVRVANDWLRRAASSGGVSLARRVIETLTVYGRGAVLSMSFVGNAEPLVLDEKTLLTGNGDDLDAQFLCGVDHIIDHLENDTRASAINEHLAYAAARGHSDAQFVMAWWYHVVHGDHKKAHEWYSKAVKGASNAYIHYNFAIMYFELGKYDHYIGTMGTAANVLEYAPAQLHMGQNYLSGQHIPKDTKQGLWLLQSAANNCSAEAMYNLGSVYRLGDGVVFDAGSSLKWYKKAANMGHSEANYWIAVLYGYDSTAGRQYLELAAKSGVMLAQNDLGTVLAAEKRFGEAIHWLKRAIDNGDETARQNLLLLQRQVMGRQLPPIPTPPKVGSDNSDWSKVAGRPLSLMRLSAHSPTNDGFSSSKLFEARPQYSELLL